MDREEPDHIAYLLRMWRANGEEKVAWRASLESPRTGRRVGFAGLDELFTFLRFISTAQELEARTSMDQEQPEYISYLLRMWRASNKGKVAWRASLENPHSGERLGFASLDKLFAFLRQQANVASGSEE